MDQVFGHRDAVAAGCDLRETRPDRNQAIAAVEGLLRRGHGGRAEAEAYMQRMIAGEDRQALQGRRRGCLEPFCESYDLRGRIPRAPADKDARARRPSQQINCAHKLRRRGYRLRHWRLIDRQLADLLRQQHDVHRQFDEHGPRLAAGRDPKGLEQGRHDLVMAGDAKRRLGQAAHELVGVHLV